MALDPAYGVFKQSLFDSLLEASRNGHDPSVEQWARKRTDEIVSCFWGQFLKNGDLGLAVMKGFNSTSDAIGISDPLGRHYFQNPAFTEMFGYTAQEMEAAGGPRVAYHSEKVFREVFDATMAGRSWSGELDMVAKGGRVFPVSLRTDAILDPAGRIEGLIGVHRDISLRRETERRLREKEVEVSIKSRELMEVNEALKSIVAQVKEDRKNFEKRIAANMGDFVLPYVRRMKDVTTDPDLVVFLNVIEDNLSQLFAPFMERLTTSRASLTPREIEVANLVRTGATSRDIAKLLNISKRAVEFHRDSLRTKLGLKKSKKNLRAYLSSFSNQG